MADINSTILQDIALKLRGHDVQSLPSIADAVEKARQSVEASNASGSASDGDRKEQDKSYAYTIILTKKRSGKIRTLSMTASSAEAAKTAAKASLGNGEKITSVSESLA